MLWRVYRRLGELRRRLPPRTIHAAWPDDRFQALLSVYQRFAIHAWDRHLLVIGSGTGFAAPLLASAGAASITLVETDPTIARHARRHIETPRTRQLGADDWTAAFDGPHYDRVLVLPHAAAPQTLLGNAQDHEAATVLVDRLARHVARTGEIHVSLPHWGGPADDDVLDGWHRALERSFLVVRRRVQRAPIDYQTDWTGSRRATARATEYTFVRDFEATPEGTEEAGHLLVAHAPRSTLPSPPYRVQIGCGAHGRDGWLNLDLRPFPGVDVVCDVTDDVRFAPAEVVFAEHFLEHLTLEQALRFFAAVHRSLEPGGWLRLSTPSLDWAVEDYRGASATDERAARALRLNLGFYGWQHRFLWNRPFLGRALEASGFTELRWPAYGESEHPALRDLERHETSPDRPDLPHVLIVEARQGEPRPEDLAAFRKYADEVFGRHCGGF